MCGLAGYAGTKPVDLDLLSWVMIDTERERGGDAWGIAWIDGRGKLRSHKQPGPFFRATDELRRAKGARLLVAHLRAVSWGTAWDNDNNHPHPCLGGWLVHNGTIPMHHWHAAVYGVPRHDNDSRVLAGLVELAPETGTPAKLAWALSEVAGGAPQAVLGIWRQPNRIVAARSGNPLHWCRHQGGLWMASLAEHLPGKAFAFPDDAAHVVVPAEGGKK
jgi:glucosamine 6-phosphate synthetase-like amidotransferase/phosphosugar isomerase protein